MVEVDDVRNILMRNVEVNVLWSTRRVRPGSAEGGEKIHLHSSKHVNKFFNSSPTFLWSFFIFFCM